MLDGASSPVKHLKKKKPINDSETGKGIAPVHFLKSVSSCKISSTAEGNCKCSVLSVELDFSDKI